MEDLRQKKAQIKQLKLKFAFDFPLTHCNELPNSSLNLIDNQMVPRQTQMIENLPLAKSLEPNQEVNLYIIHSWLSDIPDLGKTLQLQAATPCLWTMNKDPKNKYLYGILFNSHIIYSLIISFAFNSS